MTDDETRPRRREWYDDEGDDDADAVAAARAFIRREIDSGHLNRADPDQVVPADGRGRRWMVVAAVVVVILLVAFLVVGRVSADDSDSDGSSGLPVRVVSVRSGVARLG